MRQQDCENGRIEKMGDLWAYSKSRRPFEVHCPGALHKMHQKKEITSMTLMSDAVGQKALGKG